MLWPISATTWQHLRVIARAKGKPVRGHEVRYNPTSHTKTGEFLDALVASGLIEKAGTKPAANREEEKWPEQFRDTYKLTDKGKHAAEYGEYEREPKRPAPEASARARG